MDGIFLQISCQAERSEASRTSRPEQSVPEQSCFRSMPCAYDHNALGMVSEILRFAQNDTGRLCNFCYAELKCSMKCTLVKAVSKFAGG